MTDNPDSGIKVKASPKEGTMLIKSQSKNKLETKTNYLKSYSGLQQASRERKEKQIH